MYPGTVVDILLEIFVFAEDGFGDEMIELNAENRNRRCSVHISQPRYLLSLLVILSRYNKELISQLYNLPEAYAKAYVTWEESHRLQKKTITKENITFRYNCPQKTYLNDCGHISPYAQPTANLAL